MTNAPITTAKPQTAALAPFEPTNVIEAIKLSETLAASQLVPSSLRGKPSDILVVLMKGRELGMPPMAAMGQIHVIDGKACLSSDAIQGLILRSGVVDYFTLVESTDEIATYKAKRRDSPHEITLSYTIEDAKRAGLIGKANWKGYQKQMLRARCASDMGREIAPDVMAGLYDMDEADEIRANEGARTAEIVDDGRQRPRTTEALKEELAARLMPGARGEVQAGPAVPQDTRGAERPPSRDPAPVVQAAQPQAADAGEDPFGDPAPVAEPSHPNFPEDPKAWYDPAQGGIDADDHAGLEMELGVRPGRKWAEASVERCWLKGMLKEWLPCEVVLGSESGKRQKALAGALDFVRGRDPANVPPGAVMADWCLALMKKRWAIQNALGRPTS